MSTQELAMEDADQQEGNKRKWEQITLYLYENQTTIDEPPKRAKDEVIGKIAEGTEYSSEDVRDTLDYMRDVGLIEELKSNTGAGPYGLSEKGFQVAHDKKLDDRRIQHEEKVALRQSKIEKLLTKFTGYLVLVGVIQALVSLAQADSGVFLTVVLGVVIMILVYQLYNDFGDSIFK